MPVWRLQCSFGADTAFPRDRFVITPHFNDQGVTTDPQGLCDDLADALSAWVVGGRAVQVKAYDAQGTPPVFPQGDSVNDAAAFPSSNGPRELAVCLSFFSERNRPRQRGRLYVPAVLTGAGFGLRPTTTVREKVGALAPIFEGLGGGDVDWCVYSRLDDTARPVTDWWVDDEWDIIRSRGLRPTERLTGTTSEG